jgi:YidC/Oxa1 family membrane protein insertase
MSAAVHLVPILAENSLFKLVGEIFHPLFVLVATVLAFIYGIFPNYAVAIILLTILIMVILTPLTIKSTKSMIAMQALQPELQKLRQKYKGAENREQLNQEMMRLYREQGVSPTGGCLPMFLQMPALIVLYDILRGLTNTVSKGSIVSWSGKKCTAAVCADPRYIPTTSKMHANLVATPGVMKAFGLNLAIKPLTHHANWWDYIPYLALVAVAVALQYFQMNQMTKRNKAAAQMNQQMQTMQKIMPLIFAYIYFLIPAGVVIYMIVSSAIRILTQDLIFRTGIVQQAGEREIGGGGKGTGGGQARAIEAKAKVKEPTELGAGPELTNGKGTEGRPTGATEEIRAAGSTRDGETRASKGAGTAAAKAGAGRPSSGTGGGVRNPGRSKNGNRGAASGNSPAKPHPRAKAKRTRKAR